MATMMTLGVNTFTLNPEDCTVPKPERSATAIKTLGGVAFFSWGTFTAGQRVLLTWEYCPLAMFDQFQVQVVADEALVWAPGTGTSYNVEIMSLNGGFFIDQTGSAQFRKAVRLELLILSEVT